MQGHKQQQQQTSIPAPAEHNQQQQQPQNSRTSRYVTQLLEKVTPAQVQAMFAWSVQDWSRAFQEVQSQLPMLLDVLDRKDGPPGPQAPYTHVAEQHMNEVCTFALTPHSTASCCILACRGIHQPGLQQQYMTSCARPQGSASLRAVYWTGCMQGTAVAGMHLGGCRNEWGLVAWTGGCNALPLCRSALLLACMHACMHNLHIYCVQCCRPTNQTD